MAGERIMEALDLADAERAAFQEYEANVAQEGSLEATGIQPPPRNPILAAYDLEPEAYVLRVVEKISSAALHDALLVLPFGKVISLMRYLDLWAQKVGFPSNVSMSPLTQCKGLEHFTRLSHIILPLEDPSSPDSR
jgi:U3 small nucleolar RNA-associated protein 12